MFLLSHLSDPVSEILAQAQPSGSLPRSIPEAEGLIIGYHQFLDALAKAQ
jgi:hypothetical protein